MIKVKSRTVKNSIIIVPALLICDNKYKSLEYPMQHFTGFFWLSFGELNAA